MSAFCTFSHFMIALSEPAQTSGICLQFSIPENAVPIVQESWDPEQLIQSWNARRDLSSIILQ